MHPHRIECDFVPQAIEDFRVDAHPVFEYANAGRVTLELEQLFDVQQAPYGKSQDYYLSARRTRARPNHVGARRARREYCRTRSGTESRSDGIHGDRLGRKYVSTDRLVQPDF